MNGNIPLLVVKSSDFRTGRNSIARVWEEAVFYCWTAGCELKTEYDKPGDPSSRDCTMIMEVNDPFAEPRIHRNFPGGLGDLEVYRQEVIDGIHDHWIDISPGSTKWHYSYHERADGHFKRGNGSPVNQFDYVVEKLCEAPHSRRALMSMWDPTFDPLRDDSPCVQYVWFRVLDDVLNMDLHIRSNDAYKAAFMNMFVFTLLQQHIALRIGRELGRKIKVGRCVWVADSFHIYGSYFEEFKLFLNALETRSFEERTWTTEFAEPIFEETREKLAKEKK